MPKFLENKLKAEYPNEPAAPYKIMNKLGAMHGNKITAKGVQMEAKHNRDTAGLRAAHASHPNASRLGGYLHPKRSK